MAMQQTTIFPVVPKNRSLLRTASLCLRCIRWLPKYGWNGMLRKATLHRLRTAPFDRRLTRQELNRLRRESFPQPIHFAVRMTADADTLSDAVIAVKTLCEQTFSNWQLCLFCTDDAVFQALCTAADYDDRITRDMPAEDDFILYLSPSDRLHPGALSLFAVTARDRQAEVIYADEDVYTHQPCDLCQPQLRPDFSLEALRGFNYIGRCFVFRARLALQCGALLQDATPDFHDLLLRLCERTTNIAHIAAVLLYRHEQEAAQCIYDASAALSAVQAHLRRTCLPAKAFPAAHGSVRVHYDISGAPMVSILIPNKDQADTLETCVRSVVSKSTWRRFEIIIIENNSVEPRTFALYDALQREFSCVRVLRWTGEYNYAAINNFGAQHAQGDFLLLLNNDMEVLSADWLEQLLMHTQQSDTGAVGALLLYPDDTVQHAGVEIGVMLMAGHCHRHAKADAPGYMNRLCHAHDVSAVTAACMMLRTDVFRTMHGFDEALAVAFNDIDLCLRLRASGYRVVFTPHARLYHYESLSRGAENTPEKARRFERETERFHARWADVIAAGDPFYNINLSLDNEDFSPRS